MKIDYTDEEMNLNRLSCKKDTTKYKDALLRIIRDDNGCVEARYIPSLNATSHLVWRGRCPLIDGDNSRHRCHDELTLDEKNWLLTNLRYMKDGKI